MFSKRELGRLIYSITLFSLSILFAVYAPASGVPHPDRPADVFIDNAGNTYITGSSYSPNSGYNFVTIKYSPGGSVLWNRTFDGGAHDFARAITVDTDGNVIVVGMSDGGTTGMDFVTIKYDNSGNHQWTQRYNSPDNGFDEAIDVAVDASGNIYVTGTSESATTGLDFLTIHYSSTGGLNLVQHLSGAGEDRVKALTLTSTGVAVTGSSFDALSDFDYLTMYYNASGTLQWSRQYNGPGNGPDISADIASDSSGNIYVTGTASGLSGTDYVTLKYNSSGILQWTRTYSSNDGLEDRGFTLASSGDTWIAVAGTSAFMGANYDAVVILYQSDGSLNGFDDTTILLTVPMPRSMW